MVVKRVCEYCKTEFDHELGHGEGRFCSIQCVGLSHNKIAEHRDLALELFAKGNTYEEIGRAIGHSGKQVKRYFIQNHLPILSRKEAAKITREKHPFKPFVGENHPSWKGGINRTKNGYTRIKAVNNPRADRNGYVLEHILIWEQVHNKTLPEGWIIHHLNGIKSDNRPENLTAMPSKHHAHVLAVKAQRIRELEAKVKLLEKALDSSQMIFNIGEN